MENKAINKLFEQKIIYHKNIVNISFDEKLKCLIELQKLDLEMKKSTNREIKSFEVVWNLK
ncbi:MAG: hypothetical protein P4L60_17570 [Clostridium sp.]|nr:hypothetical protein [Clostridium sp.]